LALVRNGWWVDPEIGRRIGLTEDQKKQIETLEAQFQQLPRANRRSNLGTAIQQQVLTESQRTQLQAELARAAAEGVNGLQDRLRTLRQNNLVPAAPPPPSPPDGK